MRNWRCQSNCTRELIFSTLTLGVRFCLVFCFWRSRSLRCGGWGSNDGFVDARVELDRILLCSSLFGSLSIFFLRRRKCSFWQENPSVSGKKSNKTPFHLADPTHWPMNLRRQYGDSAPTLRPLLEKLPDGGFQATTKLHCGFSFLQLLCMRGEWGRMHPLSRGGSSSSCDKHELHWGEAVRPLGSSWTPEGRVQTLPPHRCIWWGAFCSSSSRTPPAIQPWIVGAGSLERDLLPPTQLHKLLATESRPSVCPDDRRKAKELPPSSENLPHSWGGTWS